MKYLYPITCLITSTAAAPTKHVLLNQVREMLLVPNQSQGSRELQLSDECLEANQAHAENPDFVSFLLDAMKECPEAIIMTQNSLTMDYSGCPSWTDSLKEACGLINGTIIPVDTRVLDCTIQGDPFKMTINTVNECFDASCDVSKYDEHIANLNSDPEMQELMDSMRAECTFSSTDQDSNQGSMGAESTFSSTNQDSNQDSIGVEGTFSSAFHLELGAGAGMVTFALTSLSALFV
eukprot:CCRYP_015033-RA/>CCRYP_015033-RA protein AED:0.04 eAED:0.04 QI:53/1/1/1/1/1/2/226/235